MKFRVTMKDSDTLYDAIEDAIQATKKEKLPNLSESEQQLICEKRQADIIRECHKWFEYGEYLTVEIDTELKTCIVIPVEETK